MINRIVYKIKKRRGSFLKKKVFNAYKLKNKDFSLISNNCIAGILYKDYNLRFCSPTINLNIPYDDFLKYVLSIQHYSKQEIAECGPLQKEFTQLGGGEVDFPCGKCEDIRILFQHYKTFEEAKNKWEERTGRINQNNIIVIFNVIGNSVTAKQIELFNSIPYKKILLTDNKELSKNTADAVFVKIKPGKCWYNTTDGARRFFEVINWTKFINN